MADINLLEDSNRQSAPVNKTNILLNQVGYVLLAVLVLVTAGLYVIYGQTTKQVAQLQQDQATAKKQTEALPNYNNLIGSQQRLKDIAGLLKAHQDWSAALPNIASATLTGVTYSKLSVGGNGLGMISGNVVSFNQLYKYIQGLKLFNSYISGYQLVNVGLGEKGGITFDLSLDFTNKLWDPNAVANQSQITQ